MTQQKTSRKCYDSDESSNVHDLEADVRGTETDCVVTGSQDSRLVVTARSYRLRAMEAQVDISSLDNNVRMDDQDTQLSKEFTFAPAEVGDPSERTIRSSVGPVTDPDLQEDVLATELVITDVSEEQISQASVFPQVEVSPDE